MQFKAGEVIVPEDQFDAELKGSIGEGPNHSNHSNSVKIAIFSRKFKNFRNFQKISTCSKLSAKFRQISSKSEQN